MIQSGCALNLYIPSTIWPKGNPYIGVHVQIWTTGFPVWNFSVQKYCVIRRFALPNQAGSLPLILFSGLLANFVEYKHVCQIYPLPSKVGFLWQSHGAPGLVNHKFVRTVAFALPGCGGSFWSFFRALPHLTWEGPSNLPVRPAQKLV